jgi:multimeric flavodoxin WrbA
MTIKILGICASPVKTGNCEAFLDIALKAAETMGEDVVTEKISLRNKKFTGCNHCHWCEDKQQVDKPPCCIKDDMLEFWPKIIEADGYLWATPVYGSNPSWLFNMFMDRWRCLAHSNFFQGALDNKVVGNLAVLWFRESGAETCLQSMIWRTLTMGMHPACGFNSRKYGAIGLSTIHGTGIIAPEDKDDKHLVLRDEHGCQSARIIGRRTVFLARVMQPIRMDEIKRKTSKMAVSGKQ